MTDARSRRSWAVLTRHFFNSFFRLSFLDDAGEESFHRAIIGLLAAIFAGGLLLARIYASKYQALRSQPTPDLYQLALPADQLLMICLSMFVVALALTLVAHSLFPDESDFRILTALPISRRLIFGAKLAAVFLFAWIFILAASTATSLPFAFVSTARWADPFGRRAVAQVLAGMVASVFSGLTIVAIQGLVTVTIPARWWRTTSVASQTMSICTLVLSLPAIARTPTLSASISAQSEWLYLVPPAWFLGAEQWLLGHRSDYFTRLGAAAVGGTAVLIAITAICYLTAYRRLDRLMLRPRIDGRPWSWNRRLTLPIAKPPGYQAVQRFIGLTVRRSGLHQLVFFGTFAAGVALAVNSVLGSIGLPSRWLARAALGVPLTLMGAGIFGLRATMLVPANLRAAWIFRFAETARSRPDQLDAIRHALFGIGVLWPTALAFPIQAAILGVQPAAGCLPVVLTLGWILVEIVVMDWHRIPFTCTVLLNKRPAVFTLVVAFLAFNAFLVFGIGFQSLAMAGPRSWAIVLGILLMIGASLRSVRLRTWGQWPLEFEDSLPDALQTLGLRDAARAPAREVLSADGGRPQSDHIEREIKGNLQHGMSLDEASTTAQRTFRNVALVEEEARAAWVSVPLDQLFQDLRFGCRILTKAPALSATAILLVALVIGGNTTIFSLLHGLLTRPAPGVQSTGLVTASWVDTSGSIEPGTSYANYVDLADHVTALHPLIAFDYDRMTLMHENQSHPVWSSLVTPDHFATLGVPIVNGRSFTAEEYEGTSRLVAVISDRAWEDYFQRAENVVGQPIVLNGYEATVVGVAAPPFRGVILGAPPADVWVPLVGYAVARGGARSLHDRTGIGRISLIGALAPGTSLSKAQAEFAGLWTRLKAAYPEINQGFEARLMPYSAIAGGNSLVATQGDAFLAVFSVVTFLTLVIVCANVASLLLGRAIIRQREIALRQSLGASRVRIVRMLLAEGFVLSVVAWGAALLFAWSVSKLTAGFIDPTPGSAVSVLNFTPDWTVASYAMVLAVIAMVAFTIAPALRAWHLDLLPWLKAGEQGVVQGRSRVSSALIVAQLAFSVLLLTIAGLAFRSLFLIGDLDSGFDTRNLLLVTINTTGSARSVETNGALLDTLRERLGEIPGVKEVTYAGGGTRWPIADVRSTGSSAKALRAEANHIGPDYLRVLGLSPVAGREFERHDSRAMPSAIISHNLAEALWPGQSPLGRTLQIEQERPFQSAAVAPQEVEVVGVTPDAFFSGFRRDRRRFLFLSAQQNPPSPGETTLYVRHTGSLDTVGPGILSRLQQADARVAVVSMRTWAAQQAESIGPIRIFTILATLFAAGSLLIAAIGQYAVVSFDVQRRGREFGVRMALGASPRQVVNSVMREQSRLTVAGLASGFTLSLVTAKGLASVLYGITPTDPLTYTGVFALLLVVSLLACYLPARRAAHNDPMALRCE